MDKWEEESKVYYTDNDAYDIDFKFTISFFRFFSAIKKFFVAFLLIDK